jgi:hypothetical protein
MLLYYLLFLILIYLIIIAYIKIKYRAWTYQPVFQYFNLFYWFKDDFIIRPQKAPLHRYCNLLNIKTTDFNKLGRDKLDVFVTFIQVNYLKNKQAEYKPTIFSLLSSLEGCNNVMISLYEKQKMLLDVKSGQPVFTDEIVGSILSKPCIINFDKRQHKAFYADFLCINPVYRNKDVAAELIQTHEYERSHNTENYTFFLVKRETKLSYIVPLVLYDVYQYTIKRILYNELTGEKYKYMSLIFSKYSLIKINKSNLQLLLEYIEEISIEYPCIILPDLGNLYNMVNNNIIIIYALIRNHKLYAAYIYKRSDMIYHIAGQQNQYQIDFIGSLCTCEKDVFLSGFRESLIKVSKSGKYKIDYLLIENLSTNNIIIDDLKYKNIRYNFCSVAAYYLYNYAKRPYFHYKTFIII